MRKLKLYTSVICLWANFCWVRLHHISDFTRSSIYIYCFTN